MNNNLIEKIQKLLKLSTSGNSNEADLAMAKAKELAIEAGIDLAVAAINMEAPEVKEEFMQNLVENGKRKPVTQRLVSWILQNHFNVRIVYTGNRAWGQHIVFFGRKSDVELATYINSFLNQEFMRRWHNYKNTGNHNARERNSFLYGLYEGLSAKLNESKKQTEEKRFVNIAQTYDAGFSEQIKSKYELMVVDEMHEREEAFSKAFPSLRRNYQRTRLTGSVDSRQAGFAAGKQINISRPLKGQLVLN